MFFSYVNLWSSVSNYVFIAVKPFVFLFIFVVNVTCLTSVFFCDIQMLLVLLFSCFGVCAFILFYSIIPTSLH